VVTNRQRSLVIGAIIVAILVIVWLISRGGGYTVNAHFETGGQLVKGANVTVGGQPVGKVESSELTDNNQANVKMKINEKSLVPFHKGTTATIRLFSMSSVASRYVSIAPGPNSAQEIPDNGVIIADNTEAPVDLDQVLNAFDPKTTKGLQQFLHGSAAQYADDPSTPLYEPAYGNAGLRWVAPFFDAGARLAAAVSADDETLSQFLVVSARATDTLAGQQDQLKALFTNLTAFTQAVSSESDELDAALAVLPTTLREGTEAFTQLRPAMAALENLSDHSAPIGDDLTPLFRKLQPLLKNAEPTLHDLRLLMRQRGSNNDLTDLFANQPALTKQAKSTFPNATTAMQSGQTILDFLRPYTPELTSWISHFGQIASNYDANGHYVRVQTQTGNFELGPASGGGQQLNPSNNKSLQQYPKTGTARCPGTATQNASDGSNPFLDNGVDCDPSVRIPGP
jgi:phospholipid/cholesterol/gamma-HCH transport system substrate-binding protein